MTWIDAELAGEPDALGFQTVRIFTGPGIARRLHTRVHALQTHEAAELVRRINSPNRNTIDLGMADKILVVDERDGTTHWESKEGHQTPHSDV